MNMTWHARIKSSKPCSLDHRLYRGQAAPRSQGIYRFYAARRSANSTLTQDFATRYISLCHRLANSLRQSTILQQKLLNLA